MPDTALTEVLRQLGELKARLARTEKMEFSTLASLTAAGYVTASGWVESSAEWTRTGDFTFTIAGDVTAAYRKGTKIRYKDGGEYEYGTVHSSSYSSPNTTVTLLNNNDYAMAAATITDTAYSHIENPEGFPAYFNFSVTLTPSAGASTITTNSSFFQTNGKTIHTTVRVFFTQATAAAGYITVTLPFTLSVSSSGGGHVIGSADVAALWGFSTSSTIVVLDYKRTASFFSIGTNRYIEISFFAAS